jgi:hypothetical protein
VIGNPFETCIALHYLIFDGVLERHPNLKILALHGGGYLGAYSGRIGQFMVLQGTGVYDNVRVGGASD